MSIISDLKFFEVGRCPVSGGRGQAHFKTDKHKHKRFWVACGHCGKVKSSNSPTEDLAWESWSNIVEWFWDRKRWAFAGAV